MSVIERTQCLFGSTVRGVLLALVLMVTVPSWALAESGDVVWTRQWGTQSHDYVYGMSVSAEGVYVTWNNRLTKFSSTGRRLWTVTTASNLWDVSADATGVYVGGSKAEGTDGSSAVAWKYSHNGTLLWSRRIDLAGDWRTVSAVGTDTTGVYVLASWHQAIDYSRASLAKLTHAGSHLWQRSLGEEIVQVHDLAVNRTGVYVTGGVVAEFTRAGPILEGVVRKYSLDGAPRWTRTVAPGETRALASGVDADGSNVYVVGSTSDAFPGKVNRGRSDAYIRSYRADGTLRWTRQFGTAGDDGLSEVDANSGSVYVTGGTTESLFGQRHHGEEDYFIRKFRCDGTPLWTRQFGTARWDYGGEIELGADESTTQQTSLRSLYVAGTTNGVFPNQPNPGGADAFLRKHER